MVLSTPENINPSRVAMVAVAALFCLLPAAVGAAEGEPPGPLPDNFGTVEPWLLRGANPAPEDLRTLAAMGVRTIVSFRQGEQRGEANMAAMLGLEYIKLPLNGRHVPPDETVEQFLSIVEDPDRRPVFVHCYRGRHRAGLMVALYRVLRQGWSADEAFDEMQAYHFGDGRLHLKDYLYRRATAAAGTPAAGEPPATGSGD